jgi:hypothetical protein
VWFTHYNQLGLIKGASSSTPTTTLTAQDIVNLSEAVWNRLLDNGLQAKELMRIFASVLAGKVSGLPGNPQFRDLADTKVRVNILTDESTGDRLTTKLIDGS